MTAQTRHIRALRRDNSASLRSRATIARANSLTFQRSTAHVERSLEVIPGGAHTHARGHDQYPENMAPIITRGAGAQVWDLDGNVFVEFGSGLRAITLGHCYEPVDDAVRAALSLGVSFARPHVSELALAERLLELFPGDNMVKFALNGSDATTAAVRLARAYTGRQRIGVCASHPFFSSQDWFVARTPMDAGVHQGEMESSGSFIFNDIGSLERMFAAHPGQFAAIILEAENGAPPRPGWFDEVRQLCDREGALFILDEVITGFRWHVRGARHVYGIRPHLSTFGKGIANGYPISALVGDREIMRLGGFVTDRDRVFLLSQTYSAQPWMMAAVGAVLDVHQQFDVCGTLAGLGARLREGFSQIVHGLGISDHLAPAGNDAGLVYVTRNRDGAPDQVMRTIFLRELLTHGVLAPNLVVNLAHEAHIDHTLSALHSAAIVYDRALNGDPAAILGGRPVQPAIRRRG